MKDETTKCTLGITRETLSAWRDQMLPEADAQRIALHVLDCAICQIRLGQFTRIATALQRQTAPDLHAQTWRGIQARLSPKEQHSMRSRIPAFSSIGIVAVLVLFGVLFATVLSHHPGTNSGQASVATPTATSIAATSTPPATPIGTATATPAATAPPSPTPTSSTTACQFSHTEPPPANVPLPPGTIIGGGNGAGGEIVTQVCTPGATQSSINAYENSHLPGAGWHPYNPSTDVNGGCADTFWTWANGHTALYWSFGNGYMGQGLPYWTIWECDRINL